MWRLVIALGAALVGYGCSRRNEEASIPTPSIPVPPPAPAHNVPLIPPNYRTGYTAPSAPSLLPDATAARPPEQSPCARFSSPVSGSMVSNAKTELERLQSRVMPLLNLHISEMRNGNFQPAQADIALTGALSTLQGIGIYLQDGTPNVIDTESDWENLNAALAYLNALGNLSSDGNPNSELSKAVRAFQAGRLTVQFKGFLFRDDEVPHGLRNQTNTYQPPADTLTFRIVTPTEYGNVARFPVLSNCTINRLHYTTVSGF